MNTKHLAMEREFIAWRMFITEFERMYGDINDGKNDRMVKKIRYWGETLAKLRSIQDPKDRQRYLEQARDLAKE